jgi:hypothetical protein
MQGQYARNIVCIFYRYHKGMGRFDRLFGLSYLFYVAARTKAGAMLE